MKPYLAIIADSFREALASRVLWILVILITLVLLALVPLGFRAEQTTEFRQGDFLDARGLVKAMHEDFDRGTPSPGQRVWSNFDESTRKTLSDFEQGDEESTRNYYAQLPKLIDALNTALKNRQLYDQQAWTGVLLGSESRELLDQGVAQLSDTDLARLNRLLIETPYQEFFRTQPPKQIFITYIGFKISPPIRASEKLVRQIVEGMVLPGIMQVLVGFIGVLAAILVTAPIIPQMFDPGALSLLLSKPVSRSLMFLAKFVGGCAFILINVTYLVVGLWAIAGLRLGIWSQGLLLCIPIFLFLFAIYYSVSSIAGVIWRNAVVCVVMTVLFWFACTVVGATKGVFEQIAVETKRLIRLVPAGDTLIAMDEQGATHRWDADSSEWQPVFLEGGGIMARVLGPIYDAERQVIYASRAGNRGMFGSDRALQVGKASDGWKPVDGPSLPDNTWELLPDPKGRLLAVTNKDIQQLTGDIEPERKKLQIFFMEIPQSLAKPFRPAGPTTPLKLASPMAAAVDAKSGNVVTYSRGDLTLLVRNGEDFELARTVPVVTDQEQDVVLAVAGNTALLAQSDGHVLEFDLPTLTLRATLEPEPDSQPRFACASPDGRRCAIVFHNGRLHTLDTSQGPDATLALADVRGQGEISAVAFAPDGAMLVADRVNRVTWYDSESGVQIKEHAPALTALEIAYYYAVVPIYTVFPKPGELDNTIQYVLSKEETVNMGMPGDNDLQSKRLKLRPWAPVRSSLFFTFVVLALACLYIERQDF